MIKNTILGNNNLLIIAEKKTVPAKGESDDVNRLPKEHKRGRWRVSKPRANVEALVVVDTVKGE